MQNALVPFDNQNLFDDRGHLTGAGLNAMENGSLDELGSLEAAEHLSFCDACLNRYTNWLEAMPQALLSPARDIAPQVQNLLRMRSIRVFTNKYVSIAAAVILAFALWNFGAFNISTGAAQRGVDRLAEGPRFSISQSIQQFIGGSHSGLCTVEFRGVQYQHRRRAARRGPPGRGAAVLHQPEHPAVYRRHRQGHRRCAQRDAGLRAKRLCPAG